MGVFPGHSFIPLPRVFLLAWVPHCLITVALYNFYFQIG